MIKISDLDNRCVDVKIKEKNILKCVSGKYNILFQYPMVGSVESDNLYARYHARKNDSRLETSV